MTKPFEEKDRYEIPGLGPDSLVLDIGGYEGNWGRLICERYGCRVHIFEPVGRFYREIMNRLLNHPQRERMTVHHFGVGSTTRKDRFRIHGDMTGAFATGDEVEDVELLGIADLLQMPVFAGKQFVLKLNCEGAEFQILEAMIEHDLLRYADVIHVQFHPVVASYQARHDAIVAALLKTHDHTFQAAWCWDGFTRRT